MYARIKETRRSGHPRSRWQKRSKKDIQQIFKLSTYIRTTNWKNLAIDQNDKRRIIFVFWKPRVSMTCNT